MPDISRGRDSSAMCFISTDIICFECFAGAHDAVLG
jgi:hypothetical protein